MNLRELEGIELKGGGDAVTVFQLKNKVHIKVSFFPPTVLKSGINFRYFLEQV